MVPLFLFTDNWLKNSRNLLNCNVLLSEFRVVGHQSLAGDAMSYLYRTHKPQYELYTEMSTMSSNTRELQ